MDATTTRHAHHAKRDLAAEAAAALAEGAACRACHLYYQAANDALEATTALVERRMDSWAWKTATAAREAAAGCYEAMEQVPASWYHQTRDTQDWAVAAARWATEAEEMAQRCMEEEAHNWG